MARVLLVGKGPPERGGIPAFLTSLLDEPIPGHDLGLLNLTRPELAPAGGRVTTSNIRRTLQDIAAVWRAAGQVEVVHIHSALAPGVTLLRAGLLVLAARARGAGVIIHAHGGLLERWMRTRGRRRLAALALASAHLVVAVSSGGHAALSSVVSPTRLRLLGNGVDVARFRPADHPREGPPRVLYVGILTPRKGLLELLDASSRLTADAIAHEIWLAGGVPDEGEEAMAAVQAAASDRVNFVGTRPHEDMPGLYREADVFCLPSWWEASPLSVLEALASGVPVVATAVGDVPHMVADGVTGYVVPPRDPERLAGALRRLLTDPDRRATMGAAARRAAEGDHALATVRATLAEHYREVADRRTRPRRDPR